MDVTVYDALNAIAGRSDWLDSLLTAAATDLPLVLGVLVVATWFWPGAVEDRAQRERLAAYAVAAALLGLAVAQIIGHLWFRERPYIDHPAHLLLNPSADPSFPSDHAIGGFALALPFVFARHRIGWLLLVLATLLSLVRVAVGTHYPSDVAGGAAIGAAAAWTVWICRGLVERPLSFGLSLARRFRLA